MDNLNAPSLDEDINLKVYSVTVTSNSYSACMQ